VYTRAGEVLLLERREPAGWWQSVTGSLEPDEMPWEAAVRELAEETGLAPAGLLDLGVNQVFAIAPAWRHRFAPDVTENLEHAFALRVAEPVAVTIDPLEHLRFEWLPWRRPWSAPARPPTAPPSSSSGVSSQAAERCRSPTRASRQVLCMCNILAAGGRRTLYL
jgi:dihydroneopterin triphosphate diphosphatase